MPFEAECSEYILLYIFYKDSTEKGCEVWHGPIMLCMELAGTRSEPKLRLSLSTQSPGLGAPASHSLGSMVRPLQGTLLWRVIRFKSYVSPRMETLFPILMWTGIMFLSWSHHIHSLCFDHEYWRVKHKPPTGCLAWPQTTPTSRGSLQRTHRQ